MSATGSQAFSRFVAEMSWLFFCLGRQRSAIVKRSVFCAIISFAVLSLSLTFRVSSASAGETSLALESQGGDWIGQGQKLFYTPADGSFSVSSSRNYVAIDFMNLPTDWLLFFAAPNNEPLAVGVYTNTGSFEGPTTPRLDVMGDGRGCNTVTGFFHVKEITYGAGDSVASFWAIFEQHCEGVIPALLGEVRYNANTSVTLAAPKTKIAQVGNGLNFTVTAKVTSGDVATLRASGLPPGASFIDKGNNTGTFLWTPALGQTGPLAVTFEAANAQGGFDSTTTSIAVGTVVRVPGDVRTIQGAIDLALDGNQILVSPGVYQENINFHGKSLNVVSAEGPDVTVIDGSQADSVVRFESGEDSDAVIEGFTIQNGKSLLDVPEYGNGGGIRVLYSSPTIRGNIISDNQGCDGSGVYVDSGSAILQGNVITRNTQFPYCSAPAGGGGIGVSHGSRVRIEGNTISNNFVQYSGGGGISLYYAVTPVIINNTIYGNIARTTSGRSTGGGILIFGGWTATITQNLIVGNSAERGGGIYWQVGNDSGPMLLNNTIADNDAQLGSAIYSGGFNAQTPIVNNILVAKAGQSAIYCSSDYGVALARFVSSDVFTPAGRPYGGACVDQSGAYGNISKDPLFANSSVLDYRLKPTSPSIDSGDSSVSGLLDTDIGGRPRIADGNGDLVMSVDMGAYEFTTEADGYLVREVTSITPNPVDLTLPSATLTIAGSGFVDAGFGLPVVNFMRGGQLLAQARARSGTLTTLYVPFPGMMSIFGGTVPGLSAGPVTVSVYDQTSADGWILVGNTSLAVNETPPFVTSILPSGIDLPTPPGGFWIFGYGFKDSGFGLPVVNFTRSGSEELLAQVRATDKNSLSIAIPFPGRTDIFGGPLPGLSAGAVTVSVYNQTGRNSWALVGSTSLTASDSPLVSSIMPNPIDLASPPPVFNISGGGLADTGFGLPVVNFTRNGQLLAQVRASSGAGTSLSVPFPGTTSVFGGELPGLSAGSVTVSVYNQTGTNNWSLIGSVSLTVNNSPPSVTSIDPNPVDLASPSPFSIAGVGFRDFGFGLPVVNFTSGTTGQLLAQVRAESLGVVTGTSLTVGFPGTTNIFGGSVPGLSAGPVTVSVYNQTGANSWSFVGSTSLTVNDSRISVGSITPNSIDLALLPAALSIMGSGFANAGFGPPVVNFTRDGQLLAQARAGSATGTTLSVPLPGTTNIFGAPLPGLSAGLVTVEVWNQTGSATWSFVGSISLMINDSRPAQVRIWNTVCLNSDQGCIYFGGQLTASEGYTWFATTGSYSPYQAVTSRTLSNFTFEALGWGVSDTYSGSVNIAAGRRYVLFVTVDENGNLLILAYDEGSTGLTAQELASSSQAIYRRKDVSTAPFCRGPGKRLSVAAGVTEYL